MATRKIKDAKDLSTNELIYFKGHAKATYMSDSRSVEDVINSTKGQVEELLGIIPGLENAINTHNKEVRFFCIEPVVVKVGDVEHHCEANQVATIFVGDEDFEIIPTSNESIQTLLAYPKPLTWYDWLEGVDSFSGIVFDMNELDTYKHWIQYYQDEYHVQKAQYSNCIFWSDKPYTHSPFEERTNYTLYYSAELPLCYSRIPENTYKPFYLAYGVKTDPNWNNPDYINSYSNVSGATQTFSYYGMSAIGIFDMAVHPIKLPKDCRGLMYHAPAIQHAGVFDAINTTNFGAKKGSWQDAFGDCISLTSLYIQNLKASINISWSPVNADSIEFIVNNAANTSAITISVSPYTWYRLSDEIKAAASAKKITIALLTGNYQDDSRWNTKQDKVEGKGLSTEDFTTELKSKLSGLSNYDDTQINQAVESLQTQLNTLVSGNASTAIESFNEIIAFLNGIEDSQSLDSIIASIEQQIASKVESDSLAKVATSGSYNDLSDKPTIPAEQVNADWNATSGKAQILNKPTIPAAVTESTVSGWGFTKNEGTYSKPSDGIPKTDLASDVQSSLDKADTALQSYTEQYTGTVRGININGTTNYPNPGGIVYLEDIGGGNTGYPIVRENTDFLPQSGVYNMYVEPNTYHILTKTTEIAHEIKINLNSYDPFNTEEYVIELVGFEDIDTITMPSGVNWADVKSPSIIEGATIIMSIVNGKGVWAKF